METKNKIVLLAEDDDDDRSMFAEALAIVDPTIVFFSSENGCEALKRLETRGFSPDIIFMDINMPIMNGIECLQKIRQSKDYDAIPVVMVTTCGRNETREECATQGAADFIQKPYSIDKMVADIKRVFAAIP